MASTDRWSFNIIKGFRTQDLEGRKCRTKTSECDKLLETLWEDEFSNWWLNDYNVSQYIKWWLYIIASEWVLN